MTKPSLEIENNYQQLVAGVDEAGRGPLIGPVVAAAVIIDKNKLNDDIRDSKKLSAKKREYLFQFITENYQYGIGLANHQEIDQLNILQASLLAMERSIENLPVLPYIALIDGNRAPKKQLCKYLAIVKGDQKSLSISAASIIAKVTRDRIIRDLHDLHPQYNWLENQGYPTKFHLEAIDRHGITPYHRKTFSPIKTIIDAQDIKIEIEQL